MKDEGCFSEVKRETGTVNTGEFSPEEFQEYLLSGNYDTFFVEYRGNLAERVKNLDYVKIYSTERFFAIVYVIRGMLNQLLEAVPEIINFEPNYPHTLSQLSLEKALDFSVINKGSTTLDGEGVIVGIIGTGIDYLNPRFIGENGESRIVAMWDQTVTTGPSPEVIVFGTEYNKRDINEIIKSANLNLTSNTQVPTRDVEGFGTAIAGLIGGRRLSSDFKFQSIAPKCEFAIVNLLPGNSEYNESFGIVQGGSKVFPTSRIMAAIRYLSYVQRTENKPMVVYLPLGSNFGERNAFTTLERYIDIMTQRRDFAIVTNSGNQGHGETHASGTIYKTGDTREVFINVGEGQKCLYANIYTRDIDVIFVSVIAPTGETILRIPMKEESLFQSYEAKGVRLDYFVQQKQRGTMNLDLMLKNIYEGVWKISLFGQQILSGLYDVWLPSKELLQGDTRFLETSPFTTLLTPGSSTNIIVASYFDNVNNEINPNSGKGYTRSGIIHPAIACVGSKLLTVGINNSLVTGSGDALAGAMLAGAAVLVYQWGLVQGNLRELYPPQLKNLLISSTIKKDNIRYPNEEWGYGRLSLEKLGEILKDEEKENNRGSSTRSNSTWSNNFNEYLYVSIPHEIYRRLENEDKYS